MAEILGAVRAEVAARPAIDPSLPPLNEMIAELRRLDAKRFASGRNGRTTSRGLGARLRNWFGGRSVTHQGATI
ncbi:MAG TPA: hypothetical protein VF170_09975 [Planctomycetaceae bacterium]